MLDFSFKMVLARAASAQNDSLEDWFSISSTRRFFVSTSKTPPERVEPPHQVFDLFFKCFQARNIFHGLDPSTTFFRTKLTEYLD